MKKKLKIKNGKRHNYLWFYVSLLNQLVDTLAIILEVTLYSVIRIFVRMKENNIFLLVAREENIECHQYVIDEEGKTRIRLIDFVVKDDENHDKILTKSEIESRLNYVGQINLAQGIIHIREFEDNIIFMLNNPGFKQEAQLRTKFKAQMLALDEINSSQVIGSELETGEKTIFNKKDYKKIIVEEKKNTCDICVLIRSSEQEDEEDEFHILLNQKVPV